MSENTDYTPKELYTEEMLAEINGRLRSRWIILAAVVIALLVVFIVSLIQRVKWVSMASAVAVEQIVFQVSGSWRYFST